MKFLRIDGYLIDLEKICYIRVWGFQAMDIYFAGRKRPLGIDKKYVKVLSQFLDPIQIVEPPDEFEKRDVAPCGPGPLSLLDRMEGTSGEKQAC